MKAPPFGYVRANSMDHAFRLLAEYGEGSKVLAGGQSLLATLAFRLSEPSLLIDISRLSELAGITRQDDFVRVGAGTTHTMLGRDSLIQAHVPLLNDAVPYIAHTAIRNRGTIGGALAFADPAAELPACCVALDATIIAGSSRGERRIRASAFFVGLFVTALEPDEIIIAVEFPVVRTDERSVLMEIARRSGDYAMAGVALWARVDGLVLHAPRVVFFGVDDRPVLASGAGTALDGKRADAATVELAQTALDRDLDPPGDQHGGPALKRQLARTLLARAVAQILTQDKVARA
ncbi:MAG: xanthine dehydrogenase family protein subunit M [Hyphomicrobiaceae bacterium]|nr:xanthine dehydrogenase family protein subunit M [Hyphomicrobiaceae bacterium]